MEHRLLLVRIAEQSVDDAFRLFSAFNGNDEFKQVFPILRVDDGVDRTLALGGLQAVVDDGVLLARLVPLARVAHSLASTVRRWRGAAGNGRGRYPSSSRGLLLMYGLRRGLSVDRDLASRLLHLVGGVEPREFLREGAAQSQCLG